MAKIGTFEWNIQTGVNVWTPELETMYGLQPGEFNKTQTAWEQLVYPEDLPKALCLVDHAIQTGEPVEGEWRIVWSDGSIHWLTGRWQVFKDANGKPLRMTGVNIDITESKRVEDALKISEKHLNDLISSIQDGFFDLDWEWRFTYINKRAAKNVGFEPEELFGESIWEKFTWTANSEYETVFRKVMETRQPASFEIKSLIGDQWYEISVYPSSSGISVFWKDITDRKRTEEILDISEKNFRSIFEHSKMGIIMRDIEGRVIGSW